MITWLWRITVTNPAGAPETLRFANREYYPTTGDDAREPILTSWIASEARRATVTEDAYGVQHGTALVETGGIVPRIPSALVVANRRLADDTRELDYLFDEGYDFKNGTAEGLQAITEGDPTPADFVTRFTGVIRRRPERSASVDEGRVTFHIESTTSKLKVPLLSKTFSGMAGWLLQDGGTNFVTNAGDAPDIFADDWTVSLYCSMRATTGECNLFRVLDGSGNPMVRLYRDYASEEMRLDITETWPGTIDTYSLFSTDGLGGDPPMDVNDWFWVTISWDGTGGTFNVYTDGTFVAAGEFDHPVVDETILSAGEPDDTADKVSLEPTGTIRTIVSACRIWSRSLTEEEVRKRHGVLDAAYESDLEVSWEMDYRIGDIVADHSIHGRHVQIGVTSHWGSIIDGDRDLEGQPYPLVLGIAHGVPGLGLDTRLGREAFTASGHQLTHVYAKGIPLVVSAVSASADLNFRHDVGSIDMDAEGVFGAQLMAGQRIEVYGGVPTAFTGFYDIDRIVPYPLRAIRLRGEDHRFTVFVEDPGWVSSGTATHQTRAVPGHVNYTQEQYESPYHPGEAVRTFLACEVNQATPDPITADVVGDPEILVNVTPVGGEYIPPHDLGNVLLQAAITYGPQLDAADFVVPDHGDFPFIVGVYVNDFRHAYEVMDELAAGCLVWIKESDAGVLSFQRFAFPEDVATVWDLDGVLIHKVEEITSPFDQEKPTAVDVLYHRNWTVIENVAGGADDETRSFARSEWRKSRRGDLTVDDADAPDFVTYEHQPPLAAELGDDVLRLSRGSILRITFSDEPTAIRDGYKIGDRATLDDPTVGVVSLDGIIVRRSEHMTRPVIELDIWRD
jgi:hypothetical protein